MKQRITTVLLALALLLSGALAGCASQEPLASEPVSMMIATDLHYLSPELTDKGELYQQVASNGDGKVFMYLSEITDAFCNQVIENQPDILILSGDLTLNGAAKSHNGLIEKLKAVQESGVQVLVIPGNHDLDGAAAAFIGAEIQPTEAFTSADFASAYETFGPAQAISRDETTFSYIFEAGPDLWILMLDANMGGKGFVKDSTLEWLEPQLKQAQKSGISVISVSHQNLYAHSNLLSFGYELYNSDAVAELFQKYGVKCNFSGHIHIQSIATGDAADGGAVAGGPITEIATSALTVSPLQYGQIDYADGVLTYSAENVDVESWAVDNGSTDENLLDFTQYANTIFADTALNQVRSSYADSGLTSEEIELLAQTFAGINQAYFGGLELDSADYAEGLKLLRSLPGSFFSSYIESMLQIEGKNLQEVTIPLQ
ncbi:MAG: metallophosphoesterase [Firmicutes bacterium]|nr:metallophosphoesterase [Bacillota bacterium]